MRKLAAGPLLAVGVLVLYGNTGPASAAEMQPGLWRFTQTTQAGGRGRNRASTRCVTPAQAANPARYFTPLGSGCVLTSHSSFGSRISSSLRCSQGSTTTEVNSTIVFSSSAALTITTTMATKSPRGTATAVMNGTGQRLAACGGRRRG